MRFGKNLTSVTIPQWKSCYLDYQHLKIFVMLLKEIVEMIQKVEKYIIEKGTRSGVEESRQDMNLNEELQTSERSLTVRTLKQILAQLKENAELVNQDFYSAHKKQMDLNRTFIQMKLLELNVGFEKLKKIHRIKLEKQENELLLSLIQYVYIQTIYMESMKETNKEGERKIIKKYDKYCKKLFDSPKPSTSKINRLSICMKKFEESVEDLYVQISDGPSKKNREYLRNLAKKNQSENADTFIFGSWVGICLSIFTVLLIILIRADKNVETDPIFNRDFPTWRGIAFFIIYIWILGMNTFMFQKYCVSHRIIFKHQDHYYSTPVDMFKIAGFFTTIFFILFLIYTLQLADIADLTEVGQHYLSLFVWGAFLIYLVLPIPILNWRGRLFGWKMALTSALSPFFGVTFPVIWMTDQLVSLVTPFKDFAYTICYYTLLDLQSQSTQNTCSDATRVEVVFAVGAVAYGMRILQCMRQGYDNKVYLLEPQFFNTIKYVSSLITLTLSYFWKAGNDEIFAAWLFWAAFSTIYSYIWDLKMDWGLFQKGSRHRFLRNNLTYTPVSMYYVIMILNLIFRLAWVLTLSPSIVESFGSAHLFTLITGALQILRRGFWNLFRVEKEHLVNCNNFKAIPNQKPIQEKLYSKIQEKAQENNNEDQVTQMINSVKGEEETYKKQIYDNFLPLIEELLQQQGNNKEERKERANQIQKNIQRLNERLEEIIRKQNEKIERK